MSGHNKWSKVKRIKGPLDAKRGKLFTKLIKEITVAARSGGGNPDGNPRLRHAITTAKGASMPKDNIERAIKKGTGELEGEMIEEITYEGYGPGGVALLIETTTDNKNRTVNDLRTLFKSAGGSLGESGSVAWMFNRYGQLLFEPKKYLNWTLQEFSGPDARDFLHRLTTVNLHRLGQGDGSPGFFLTAVGKIRAYFFLGCTGEDAFVFEFDAGRDGAWAGGLAQAIDQ